MRYGILRDDRKLALPFTIELMLKDVLQEYNDVKMNLPSTVVIANLRARRRFPRTVGAVARKVTCLLGLIDRFTEPIAETDGAEPTADTDFSFRVTWCDG